MKGETFVQMQKELFDEALQVGVSKGNEYAGVDRFANFKTAAELSGITVGQSLMNYFVKHVRSISNYVRKDGDVVMNEPFRERIIDAINYLCIMEAWYGQERKTESGGESRQGLLPVHPGEGRGVSSFRP